MDEELTYEEYVATMESKMRVLNGRIQLLEEEIERRERWIRMHMAEHHDVLSTQLPRTFAPYGTHTILDELFRSTRRR